MAERPGDGPPGRSSAVPFEIREDAMQATRWVLTVVLLAVANAASAQILTGTLIGTVRDESGAVLPGTTVTVTSPALPAGAASSATNANGEYRFTDLPPGSYALRFELAGFGTYEEQGLRVVVGGTIERLVTLKVAAVAETVTVSGATPMVDPRKPGVASNIEQEVLKDLPISRLAIYEFTKWTVGATPNDPGGTSGAVSVMGAADSENSVLYDSQNSN